MLIPTDEHGALFGGECDEVVIPRVWRARRSRHVRIAENGPQWPGLTPPRAVLGLHGQGASVVLRQVVA